MAVDAMLPSHELFQDWLEDMQPRLARFMDFLVPPDVAPDFTRESLERLERHLLRQFATPDSFSASAGAGDFVDGTVRYIGETYLRAFGGGWQYSVDPKFVFAGRPYIRLDTLDRTPISPFNLTTALLKRRTGAELVKVYDAQSRRIEQRRAQEAPGWQPRREAVPGLVVPTETRLQANPPLEEWLSRMEEELRSWRSSLGEERAVSLDFSERSLTHLEQLVRDQVPNVGILESAERSEFVDGAVRYVGETFRRVAGGEWRLNPGSAQSPNPYVGRPYVARLDDEGDERRSVPLLALGRVVEHRRPGLLTAALRTYAD